MVKLTFLSLLVVGLDAGSFAAAFFLRWDADEGVSVSESLSESLSDLACLRGDFLATVCEAAFLGDDFLEGEETFVFFLCWDVDEVISGAESLSESLSDSAGLLGDFLATACVAAFLGDDFLGKETFSVVFDFFAAVFVSFLLVAFTSDFCDVGSSSAELSLEAVSDSSLVS